MSKKGKFNLFSFLIEDKLIFYKSSNRTNKLIAFSIFKANDIPKIICILNDFLKKRLIKSYSLQIDVSNKHAKFFFLSFEDQDKDRILNSFNLIYQILTKAISFIYFYKNNNLMHHLLNIASIKISPKLTLSLNEGTLLIKNDEKIIILHGFQININLIKNKTSFFYTLIKLLRNLNHTGFLIFNFNVDNQYNNLISSYYIDMTKKDENKPFNIEYEINSIYKENIFRKIEVERNLVYRIFWRNNLTDVFFIENEFLEFFVTFSTYNFQNLSNFSNQFEGDLKLNQIDIHKLSRNLMLLDQSILLLIIDKLEIDLIDKVLKRYLSTYHIFIIILSLPIYNKILELHNIDSIKNLTLLNVKDVIDFDFSKIKRVSSLKNT
jgi:hypothetical protein